MGDRFVADAGGELLAALTARFPEWSRNTLRQRLRLRCVLVNGAVADRADHALRAGDTVEVLAKAAAAAPRAAASLRVLFADDDLVAIDKPAGLLAVGTDDEHDRTALALLRASLAPGSATALWPVHRLDRETSGVLLFARSREVRDAVQAAWRTAAKTYLAVVAGHPRPPAGTIEVPLWEDRNLRVHAGEHAAARPARTRYATRRTGRARALLEVELDTGRKHQIRVHLAHLGHAVVGDERYGVRDARLGLHALRLALRHPRDGRELAIEAPPPRALLALVH